MTLEPNGHGRPLRHGPNRPPRIVIVGGGAAGLEALLGLRALAGDGVGIELLTKDLQFTYRPLAVGEPFGMGSARRYAIEDLAGEHDVTVTHGVLASVDSENHSAQTTRGEQIEYDALVMAPGAKLGTGLPGAIAVRGPDFTGLFAALLDELERGAVTRVAFASPPGVAWQMPLYELALMTSARLAERGVQGANLHFVTPEAAPLELFGPEASTAIRQLLDERGLVLHTGCYPAAFERGELVLIPRDSSPLAVERVVSLPQISGPSIAGLPHDPDGFIPVDLHGRVSGVEDVYAAGDATTFPIKQGGLATQQADAVVEHLAARAGAAVTPAPFRPVLRGVLLTGAAPRYLRSEISGGRGAEEVSQHALWWPPSKIAGRYLSPYLGLHHRELEVDVGSGLPVEVELSIDPDSSGVIRRRGIIINAEARTEILGLDRDADDR